MVGIGAEVVVATSKCGGAAGTEATVLVLAGCGSAESELSELPQLAAIRKRGIIRLSAKR